MVPVNKVLEGAADAGLREVLVIGTDANGQSFVASCHKTIGPNLFLLERAKAHLMALAEEHEEMRGHE